MSATDTLYLLAYYARDMIALTALGASIVLLILAFFHASRGLALRNTVTSIGVLALLIGTILSAVPIEQAFFLSRLSAIENLVASVIVWLFSVAIQGYYGR
jgi:uncharacterized membrane protein HdeD (DUF308 family)